VTTRTRPDQTHGPLGSPTSPRTLSGCRLFRSISTRTDGSGLVGSQTRSVGPWVRVVKFDTDQTLSETWSQARTCLVQSGPCSGISKRYDQIRPATKSGRARAKFHYTDTDRTGPDQTKSADLSETRADPADTRFCDLGLRRSLVGPT